MGVLRGEEEKGGKRYSNTVGYFSYYLDIYIFEEVIFLLFVFVCWVSYFVGFFGDVCSFYIFLFVSIGFRSCSG